MQLSQSYSILSKLATANMSRRLASMCISLGVMSVGFVVAAAIQRLLHIGDDAGLATALFVAIPFGVVECLFIQRFVSKTSLLRLDGEIFPFFSVGIAAAIVVF